MKEHDSNTAPPQAGAYRCAIVHAPWRDGRHHPAMTLRQLMRLPLRDWCADDAIVWLWAPNGRAQASGEPALAEALWLIERLEARYYTTLTWIRTGEKPDEADSPYRDTTEHCLVAYFGKARFRRESMGKMKTAFEAPPANGLDKPELFYEHVRAHFDAPRLALYAAAPIEGFDCFG